MPTEAECGDGSCPCVVALSAAVSPTSEARTFTVATINGTRIEVDIWFRCHGTAPATGYLAMTSLRHAPRTATWKACPQLQVVGFDWGQVPTRDDIATAIVSSIKGRTG